MRTLPFLFLLIALALAACAPQPLAAPTPQATQPPAPAETQVPTTAPTQPASAMNSYSNAAFGLGFQFPADWYGPEEYTSGQSLRVEIGSDKVYPYGEVPDQPSAVKNSYDIVIQYDKGTQAPPDNYTTLQGLQDGGSTSGLRSLITRVRQVDLGRFTGYEYISTLPEGAQTDHVYSREVLLYDSKTGDLITVRGQPINVELAEGADWRAAYQSVDQANQAIFENIVASLTAQ